MQLGKFFVGVILAAQFTRTNPSILSQAVSSSRADQSDLLDVDVVNMLDESSPPTLTEIRDHPLVQAVTGEIPKLKTQIQNCFIDISTSDDPIIERTLLEKDVKQMLSKKPEALAADLEKGDNLAKIAVQSLYSDDGVLFFRHLRDAMKDTHADIPDHIRAIANTITSKTKSWKINHVFLPWLETKCTQLEKIRRLANQADQWHGSTSQSAWAQALVPEKSQHGFQVQKPSGASRIRVLFGQFVSAAKSSEQHRGHRL